MVPPPQHWRKLMSCPGIKVSSLDKKKNNHWASATCRYGRSSNRRMMIGSTEKGLQAVILTVITLHLCKTPGPLASAKAWHSSTGPVTSISIPPMTKVTRTAKTTLVAFRIWTKPGMVRIGISRRTLMVIRGGRFTEWPSGSRKDSTRQTQSTLTVASRNNQMYLMFQSGRHMQIGIRLWTMQKRTTKWIGSRFWQLIGGKWQPMQRSKIRHVFREQPQLRRRSWEGWRGPRDDALNLN